MVQVAHCDTTMSGSPMEVITIVADQDPNGDAEPQGEQIGMGVMDKWLGVAQETTGVGEAQQLANRSRDGSAYAALTNRSGQHPWRCHNLPHDQTLADLGQSEIITPIPPVMCSHCMRLFQLGEDASDTG